MDNQVMQIKRWVAFFMISLALSGITAIPVETELTFISDHFSAENSTGAWLQKVLTGVQETNKQYPFIGYGYDWLAFAHIVLAVLFIGPLKDPVRNKWVIEFGMIACVLIIPFAMIVGHFRGIPFWWRIIDCGFGIIGLIPLMICYKKINQIERIVSKNTDGPQLVYSKTSMI